jgi:phosphoribosylamine--glycine ligase
MSLSSHSCAGTALEKCIDDAKLGNWVFELNRHNRQFEFDKSLNYQLLVEHSIPVPSSQTFSNTMELAQALKRPFPFVVKFDTPCMLGIQTVIVRSSRDFHTVFHTAQRIKSIAGITQQFVTGKEYTVTVLVGANNWVELGSAVDHKQQYEQAQGLNTFGTGSFAPCGYVHPDTQHIVDQTVTALRSQHNYRGLLSCQFILEPSGKLWLLEYNTRFCDPEFQSMVSRLDQELATALKQVRSEATIDPIPQHEINAVTICLIHKDWPNTQPHRAELILPPSNFEVYQCHGAWAEHTYWGSITNSGPGSHQELAQEIYDWLEIVDVTPYRYRRDIAK